MFGWKKKKSQSQVPNSSAPTSNTSPSLPTTPPKPKKPTKDKKKHKDSPATAPNKRKGLRFGRKNKAPTTPYNDGSSGNLAGNSTGDSNSVYQSESLGLHNSSYSITSTDFEANQNGQIYNHGVGSPSASSVATTGSVGGSYRERTHSIGSRGYETKTLQMWDEDEVLQWLADQGMSYFVELFDGCEIDGEYLANVTDGDLLELEVEDESLRRQLLDAVTSAADSSQVKAVLPTWDESGPNPDHQPFILSHDIPASGDVVPKRGRTLSETSTVPADSSRRQNALPRLVPRTSAYDDSESELDFGSDSSDDPLGDLPDNSNRRGAPLRDDAGPNAADRHRANVPPIPLPRTKNVDKSPPESLVLQMNSVGIGEKSSGSRADIKSTALRGSNIDEQESDKKPSNSTTQMPATVDTAELPVASPTTPQDGREGKPSHKSRLLRRRSQTTIKRWTESDVLAWLEEAQLSRLKDRFIEHKVTGNQLLDIDMQLLDAMGINSAVDREQLLAQLYELNNPKANIPENDLISAVNNTSGYEHKKYLAAMKVFQSSDSEEVQLLPPETSIIQDSLNSSILSTGSDHGGTAEEKKKKGGLSKLKEVISPKKNESKDVNIVQVWTDIIRSGSTTVSLRLTATETVENLISLTLERLGLVEDWRLYSLVEVGGPLSNHSDKGFERLIDDSEHPLTIQQEWSERTPHHFQLRQRPAHGGHIKIVLRLSQETTKGKMVAISLSTPAREVIALGLLKFSMLDADPAMFCLLEIDGAGDLLDVDPDSLPLQSDSHAFVLCEMASKDNQLALSEEENEEAANEEAVSGVQRNDSLKSRDSSRVSVSGVSIGSSASSDLLVSHRVDDTKLSKLEEEMATIEESLGQSKGRSKTPMPRLGTSTPQPQSAAAAAVATAVAAVAAAAPAPAPAPAPPQTTPRISDSFQSDLVAKDTLIENLTQENKALQEKAKQLAVIQKALNQLEQTYKKNEADTKQRVQEKRNSLTADAGESFVPKAVADVQSRLVRVGEEIKDKKLNILKIQQRQKQVQGRNLDNLDVSIQQAELEYRVALEESSMVTLQQQQAQLLSTLELALTDHQVAIERKKSSSRRTQESLFRSLDGDCKYSLHAVRTTRNKHDFEISTYRDGRGVVIERCSQDSGLELYDRLLEVNGQDVRDTASSDVVRLLANKSSALELVLLREETSENERREDEMEGMRQHLELIQRDNQRLQEEARRMKGLEFQARQATHLEMKVQQLETQLTESELHIEDLENHLADKDNDQYLHELQADKHNLQMEVIHLKEDLCVLENTVDDKTNELAIVYQERDNARDQLMIETGQTTSTSSHHLINQSLEDGLPLWEALRSSSKREILDVLQDELEEAGRQKDYLDQLYALMLERAPRLLDELEEDFDASELSANEEFC